MFSNKKAALSRQLAFSLMLFSILISCKDNSISSGYVNESKIVVDTLLISEFTENSLDPYLGRLTYSPAGKFSDPLFGDLESIAFFQPGIAISGTDSIISATNNFHLRLYVFPDEQFGDTLDNTSFSIYRVESPWRGTTFRQSDEVNIAEKIEANKVGSFDLSNVVDTTNFVDIPLSGSWVDDYRALYQNQTNRDSVYRYSDFGLTIVPDDGANQLVYFGFGNSELMIFESNNPTDTLSQAIIDWGYDISRGEDTIPDENIALFSTLDNYLKLDFSDNVQQLNGPNFVRAELVLTENEELLAQTLSTNQIRNNMPNVGLRVTRANDLAYEFGFTSPNSIGSYDDGKYRFNLTTLLNANIFGSTPVDEIYLYAAPSNGLLGLNTFFGTTASRNNVPKMLIYRLDTEE